MYLIEASLDTALFSGAREKEMFYREKGNKQELKCFHLDPKWCLR